MAAIQTDRPVTLSTLREAIKRLPGAVYRVKGFVYSDEDPEHRVIVQVVGKRIDIVRDEPWGDRRPGTQIVAIGAAGAITADMLGEVFLQAA